MSDTDLAGATVVVRLDASMEKFIEMSRIADVDEVSMEGVMDLARQFGDELIMEWDLMEDNDEETPIPANGNGMVMLPLRLAMIIIGAWTAKMQAVPAPLVSGSQNGGQLDPASIGLGELSKSLPPSESPGL